MARRVREQRTSATCCLEPVCLMWLFARLAPGVGSVSHADRSHWARARSSPEPRRMSMLSGDARSLSYDAYVYLYPLVTMEVTRRQIINGTKPGFGAPNEFHHIRAFPPADFRAVVRPNFDTL